MKRQTILKNISVGKTFEVWGKKFTVLKQDEDKVFVLAAEFATTVQFREEDKEYRVAPNDFRDSSIKEYLNGEYIDGLVAAGADRNEDIFPLTVDLKCTMGQREYGTDTVEAGLLTLEQYGEFYDIIPLIEADWWCLATPWKTPSRSPHTDYTNYVWIVHTNGDGGNGSYSNSYGVRPALNLSPFLLVSYEDDRVFETLKNRVIELEELYEDLKEENLETIRRIKQAIKSARARGVREFAEKLKSTMTINNTSDGYLDYTIDYNSLMEDIDNLVEEMIEGK